MKILCQERYDKAVAYAKEIKNDTPHSFGFRQVYSDGRTGIVGGLLYHGQPDQSFAVLMNPIHGWTIHT